jgi:hypothetical protein
MFGMSLEVFLWGFVPQQCRKHGRVMKVTGSPVEQIFDILCKASVTLQRVFVCLL